MRRKNDFYPTPKELTLALREHMGWDGKKSLAFYEPCNGNGDISQILKYNPVHMVTTADIDPTLRADYLLDATSQWPKDITGSYSLGMDWVVTNPPFNAAYGIIENLLSNKKYIKTGIAMLLRLSFLEPTNDRAEFLSLIPPTDLLVMPRTSFTKDGKTDSVTCAWMVWEFERTGKDQKIKVYTKRDLQLLKEEFENGEKYGKGGTSSGTFARRYSANFATGLDWTIKASAIRAATD